MVCIQSCYLVFKIGEAVCDSLDALCSTKKQAWKFEDLVQVVKNFEWNQEKRAYDGQEQNVDKLSEATSFLKILRLKVALSKLNTYDATLLSHERGCKCDKTNR